MNSAITVLELRGDALDNAETRTGHTTFSYEQLAFDIAEMVQQSADRIHERIKRASEEVFPIGRELNRVKDVLPHGTFLAWVEAEFGWSQRTA
jgi:hypothetical protein